MATLPPGNGAIGFRLAHELEGLLQGIAADGHITADETDRLRRWRDANVEFQHLRPFGELAAHVDRALADGCLDVEECQDLLFVVSKLTTVNPYFDVCRTGLQMLMGLLTGVAADGVVTDREIAHLQQWMEDWSHICGVWPFTECEAVVTKVLVEGRVGGGHEQLILLAKQLPVRTISKEGEDVPPLVLGALYAVAPEIAFANRTFVFTGDSQQAERPALAKRVGDNGGLFDDTVTKRTDYLVVCDDGSPMWAFSCYGRKIEKAYQMRRQGHHVLIIQERDFWDAMTL